MVTFKATVYVNLISSIAAKALADARIPEDVEIEVIKSENPLNDIRDKSGSGAIVITDNADVVSSVKEDKPKNCFLVFCGRLDMIWNNRSVIDDFWELSDDELKGPAEDDSQEPSVEVHQGLPYEGNQKLKKETAEIKIQMRYEWLIGRLSASFRAVFYRNALFTTIDTVPDMLWYKRLDGIHTMVNSAFTEIVHKTREDVIGKDHFYIWDAPRPAEGNNFACAESEDIAISTGKMYVCDEPVKTREGLKQFTTYKTPLYDPYGNVYGTVGVGHDVTNFSNLGIELSILIENMPFPMTIFDTEWNVVRMNRHFKRIVGADKIKDFCYTDWKSKVPVPVGVPKEDKNRHTITREYQIEVEGGLKYYVFNELEIRDFFDNISGYFCTLRDITYQRTYEESIIKAANTDVLTGMNNRRYFYDYLSENKGSTFHLIYIDLDRFKAVNDKYGHDVGDSVLIKTSELIQSIFSDCVTARLGGDEFAVIYEKGDSAEIGRRCDKFEKAVHDAFEKYNCGTGASMGMVYSDGKSVDIDELIHESDLKMYEMKKIHHGEDLEKTE